MKKGVKNDIAAAIKKKEVVIQHYAAIKKLKFVWRKRPSEFLFVDNKPYTLYPQRMPRTTSAKKALRQNIRRRAQNRERKEKLAKIIKQFKKLLTEGKKDEAKQYLATVYKTADKMAKVNLIKKNKANRIKSRLAQKIESRK